MRYIVTRDATIGGTAYKAGATIEIDSAYAARLGSQSEGLLEPVYERAIEQAPQDRMVKKAKRTR